MIDPNMYPTAVLTILANIGEAGDEGLSFVNIQRTLYPRVHKPGGTWPATWDQYTYRRGFYCTSLCTMRAYGKYPERKGILNRFCTKLKNGKYILNEAGAIKLAVAERHLKQRPTKRV